MKSQFIKASLLVAALLGASVAFAAPGADGTPVADGGKVTRQVTITQQTQYFNVRQGDTLRFTQDDGKQFSWKFDGNSNYVTLSDIAPQGSVNQDVKIYVGYRPKQRS